MRLHQVGQAVAARLGMDAGDASALDRTPALPRWASALRVGELAYDSVALSSLAIALVGSDRGLFGLTPGAIVVDPLRVQASFGSERLFRADGEVPSIWATLSGFWRVADGWVRTHGNYPHHAERLARLLDIPVDAPRERIADAVRGWTRFELEDRAAEERALAFAVRAPDEWRAHPQHPVLATAPVVSFTATDDGAPARGWRGGAAGPLDGIRVLDLTRVIAGPVAARDLALGGADVLRVDSPRLPETELQHLDTGQGKRSTRLDLDDPSDRRAFDRLLTEADVIVHGYRPGALDRFGLDAPTLHERHPGLVVARLSAWGGAGPWGGRRGFDSLVQAATGIAVAESADGGATPGALPVQALDHSAGHFLAASIATALRAQRARGGSYEVGISLARVAESLLAAGSAEEQDSDAGAAPLPTVTTHVSPHGGMPAAIRCAPPVLAFPGAPAEYATGVHRWGSDLPTWAKEV